jgi:imidazole glycerol-phosphate synthase subunit HisF
MVKKRLVGVITVKNGLAVQSIGYRRYLPLGRPEILAANLDRWGCDEILILCIDRSSRGLGPDFELLNKLAKMRLFTPLIYGGGIVTMEQAALVIHHGADRLCVDTVLHQHDLKPLREMAALLGTQAMIGVFPLSITCAGLQWLDHRSGVSKPFLYENVGFFDEGLISEALIVDWVHEGHPEAFDMELLEHIPWSDVPLITFGGISDPTQASKILSLPRVSAVAVGNFLNYTELAVQRFKELALHPMMRPATFARFV